MNVFIIPSWYPSTNHPNTGIFNKEQAEALAYIYPGSQFAISTWGQNEEDLLLWKSDIINNLRKIKLYFSKRPEKTDLRKNLIQYYTPTFTWTRKFFSGNIRTIIENNEKHFIHFQSQTGKADVIHAHSAYPGGWVAMELAKRHKLPYVITEHMTPFPFESFLSGQGQMSLFLKNPFLNSKCNIVVSPQQLEKLQEWKIPRLKVIPNLTDEQFFQPPARPVESLSQPFTFFTLGRLEPQKGIPFLFDAIKLLIKEKEGLRFKIGGSGREENKYKHLAQELNINNHIEWLGTLNRVEALREYQQCDAFVLPSLHENLPMVLLEAIACGKPIISTRCGGPESIIHETNGILVEPADSKALYKAMDYMISHYDKFPSEKIREDFCQRYSRKVVCEQIMDVYEQVTASYRKATPLQ